MTTAPRLNPSPPALKRNVAANFLGQGWVVLMSFAFVPVYIRHLGIEAYGLIGFFVAMQAWIVIIDLGLAMTLGREMARFSQTRTDAAGIRQLLRGAEKVYAALGTAAALALLAAAPALAQHWFKAGSMPVPVVEAAVMWMGTGLVLRWAAQLYRSAIQGLQEQVWLAQFSAAAATVRAAGALLAAWQGSLIGFFAWNALASAVELAVLVWRLYAYLPASQEQPAGALAASPLRRVWRFAGAVFATNLFAVVMTQSDKFLLSGLLSLADFGVYTFAFTLGTAAAAFTTPIFQAVAPRLAADIASGHAPRVVDTYHKACQTMTLVVVPAAALGIFHSRSVIEVWSANAALAAAAAPLAAIFIAAYMVSSLVHVPAALALGYGWARWALVTNGLSAVVVLPALWFATRHFGPVGAAATNLGLNLLYFFVAVAALHRRFLVGEWRAWFLADNVVPLALALGLAGLLLWVAPAGMGRGAQAAFLVGSWALVSLCVAWALPYPRSVIAGFMPGHPARARAPPHT